MKRPIHTELALESVGLLLSESLEGPSTWHDNEYAAVLEHFLSASVEAAIEPLDPTLRAMFQREVVPECGRNVRFARILAPSPPPPLGLLRLTKDLAKQCMTCQDIGVPRPVTEVLYYVAIDSAFFYHRAWITRLDYAAVEQGTRELRQWDWVEQRIRPLLRLH